MYAYAEHWGIDSTKHPDLLWIVLQAKACPTPPPWTRHLDEQDRLYYCNAETDETTWFHPLEEEHRSTYREIVEVLESDRNEWIIQRLEEMREELKRHLMDAHTAINAISQHTGPDGVAYYYDSLKERSFWHNPAPVILHVAHLKMSAFQHLVQWANGRVPDSLAAEWSDFVSVLLSKPMEREDRISEVSEESQPEHQQRIPTTKLAGVVTQMSENIKGRPSVISNGSQVGTPSPRPPSFPNTMNQCSPRSGHPSAVLEPTAPPSPFQIMPCFNSIEEQEMYEAHREHLEAMKEFQQQAAAQWRKLIKLSGQELKDEQCYDV